MPTVRPTITVHIHPATINCTPNGGHVHCQQGDQLRWISDPPHSTFTIRVTDLYSGQPVPWPFGEPEPVWPVSDTGPLTIVRPADYKYIVTAANCQPLDPIIIVDKGLARARPARAKSPKAKTPKARKKAKSAKARRKR